MAPNISAKKEQAAAQGKDAAEAVKFLYKMREHIEENCDYVGSDFAEEARKIHHEEAEKRDIYGEATVDEAEQLREEGVEFGEIPGRRGTTPDIRVSRLSIFLSGVAMSDLEGRRPLGLCRPIGDKTLQGVNMAKSTKPGKRNLGNRRRTKAASRPKQRKRIPHRSRSCVKAQWIHADDAGSTGGSLHRVRGT